MLCGNSVDFTFNGYSLTVTCTSVPGHDGDHYDGEKRASWPNDKPAPKHTVNGKSDGPWDYGVTHDYDCPACLASGTSFTASPRSETYWSS